MNKKGFTLIELLVVIAIIGILSSIVLASLGTARKKGQIAAAKGELTDLRSQAELIYSSNGNYTALCAVPGGDDTYTSSTISDTSTSVANISDVSAVKTIKSIVKRGFSIAIGCSSSPIDQAWAAKISDGAGHFCIDSSGGVGAFNLVGSGVCAGPVTAL